MAVFPLLSLFTRSERLRSFKHFCELVLIRCGIWYPWWYEPPPAKLQDYKIIGEVRDCAFNMVYRCCRRDNEQILVAIKKLVITDENEEFRQSLSGKVAFHRFLPHQNVARMLYTITMGNCWYLVYECFPYDLSQIIEQPMNVRVPLIKKMFHQILSAVAHYHNCEIVIGDIKPKYLQMKCNMEIKLADFGFAGSFGDPWTTYPIKSSKYSAPEILFGSRRYSKAADMWCVGCIFGEMITGNPIFQGKSQNDQLKSIFRLLGAPTEESWPGLTEICSRRTLSSFSKFEPMNLLAVKLFGFEPQGIDLLSKILCLDPCRRISAANALKHDYFKGFNQRQRYVNSYSAVTQRTPPSRTLNAERSSIQQPPKRSSY